MQSIDKKRQCLSEQSCICYGDSQKTVGRDCCCFFGHREISETEELRSRLYMIVEDLIVNEKVDTFLFGSKSQFDDLCFKTVTSLKEKYPHIQRIYVRCVNQRIEGWYKDYLLCSYEDTYYPEHIANAGKASYLVRNFEMINKSHFCVAYYDEHYLPPRRKTNKRDVTDYQPKSGTKRAYEYAVKMQRKIVNVFQLL